MGTVVKKENNKMEAVVRNTTEVCESSEDWGAQEDLLGTDIEIPSVWLMQGISEWVMDRKASAGEFRNSLTQELIGAEQFEAIVFLLKKSFEVYDRNCREKDKEFLMTIPATQVDSFDIPNTHMLCYQYFVLLVTPDGLSTIPFRIKLKSSSSQTARTLNTYFQQLQRVSKKPSAAVTVKFSSKLEKFEKGPAYVWRYSKGRDATPAEIGEAYRWYNTLNSKSDILEEEEIVKGAKQIFGGRIEESDEIPF